MNRQQKKLRQRISALRIDMYQCTKGPPRDYMQDIEPTNAINKAWIPQTLYDQVWVLYEFQTVEDRMAWEESLPPDVARWINRDLIPLALRFGWGIRNENGFKTPVTA